MLDKELRRMDDERMDRLESRFDRHLEIYSQNGKELAALKNAVATLEKSVNDLRHAVISKAEFKPIRLLAYGMVGVILTTVAGAILALILK